MANKIGLSRLRSGKFLIWRTISASLITGLGLASSRAALAHHPFGDQTPTNFIEGFLSGLGHPMIGIDHFAFVVAVGLMAAILRHGFWVPAAFIATALLGTGIHLQSWNLLAPEFFISISIVILGGLLALKQGPTLWLSTGIAALAGVFHGYAYGEAIVGAEITPLVSYLAGFSVMQLAIAAIAYVCGKALNANAVKDSVLPTRFVGFAIAGMGLAFLSSVLLG
ncbi:HupE/UreJ family protein [Acaryochloris sp. CCMEE 5410]|uniref:HupE/UreJ family protein n=1 Tax=Acaryochloris sp. CCMEE 5410 TaxID=310037 RepID=UPI0002484365|nr:HupE/UreJ family protein [Acaryochloris sp. CCMEE 5410]KAI9132094.1 HupE/UreJ family protein [Acaryochloris sp. CCMEE 5410]